MIIMFSLSALILMILGCGWLFYKDYTEHRLPNYGVLLVGICALIYHICGAHLQTSPSWWNLLLGAFIGVLFMVTIRYFANRRYKTETLGMGDIKLILVSGLWVGFPFIFHVISLGAFIGVLLALGNFSYKKHLKKQNASLKNTHIPAGPGFIIALIMTVLYIDYPVIFLLTRLILNIDI